MVCFITSSRFYGNCFHPFKLILCQDEKKTNAWAICSQVFNRLGYRISCSYIGWLQMFIAVCIFFWIYQDLNISIRKLIPLPSLEYQFLVQFV